MVLCGTKARGYHPLAQALQRPGARMHAVVARVRLGRQAQRCTAPTLLRILRCVDALGPPCQSARIFCRTLPGCAAVGFVAPITCSTHAERTLASRWSDPRQPPLIRELTRTGRGAALCAVAAAAQRWRCSPARSAAGLCRLVPHSIAATGAPFLGSPSTLWHGCQTQPPSSVSAPSPDALPSRRRSAARRSAARRQRVTLAQAARGAAGACAPAVVNFSRIAM